MRRENVYVRLGWICLLVVDVGILIFGIIAAAVPTSHDQPLMRADGVASIGLGLFGLLITVIPFRRRQQWAWYALWFYPVFWTVHRRRCIVERTDVANPCLVHGQIAWASSVNAAATRVIGGASRASS